MNEPINQRNEAERLMQRLQPATASGPDHLPGSQVQQIINLAAEVRQSLKSHSNEPDGTASLDAVIHFAGPGGAGKTMAAQLLARELGAEVFRVDTAQLVSKYIGETEKNLSAVFYAAAARGNPILFFDEADALFGKRSEVKDSHDRYANSEVNYLLEHAGAYRGVVILAGNQHVCIDSAVKHTVAVQA